MIKKPAFVIKIAIAVIILIGFGALFGFEGTSSAPEIRKGPEALGIKDIQVLAGGSTDSYPGWIADNDLNTSWKPNSQATNNVIEFQLTKPSLLYGIKISATLNENDEIAFSYLQDGQWLPLPVGRKTGTAFASEITIPIANLRIVTPAIRLALTTSLNSSSKINEAGFIGISAENVFHKLVPTNITTSNGPDIVSPAAYLTDNNTYTTWNANSFRSDMISSPWDYFDPDCGKRLHKHRHGDEQNNNSNHGSDFDSQRHGDGDHGIINMAFAAGSRLKEVRFFPDADSLDALGIDAKSGLNTVPVYQFRGSFHNDWTNIPLNEIGNLSGLKIDLDGKRNKKAGMAEVECWGYGDYQGRTYLAVTDCKPLVLDKAASSMFQDQSKAGSEVYILIEGQETRTLNVNLNTETIAVAPVKTDDGNTCYIFPLRALTDTDEEQSISVLPFDSTLPGKTPVLLGIWLRNKILSGEQEEDAIDSVNQQSLERSFPEKVLLHDVEIYRPEGIFFNAAGRKGSLWNALDTLDSGSLFSRWRAPLQLNGELDGLRLSGSDRASLWGTRIIGSVESDHAPVVKILYPSPNAEIGETGDDHFPFAVVTVDNEKADLKINGRDANKFGKFYVQNLAELGLSREGSVTIHAEAVDQSGRKGEDTIIVSLSDFLFTLNLPQGINRTDKPTIVVSGTTQTPHVSIKVNGQSVDVRNKSFSKTVSLTEGMNNITIQGKDDRTSKERTAARQVFYNPIAIALTIDNPLAGQYLSAPTVQVNGMVSGGTSVKVLVNGSQATVTGTRYLSNAVTLKEGANTITVQASDSQGHSVVKTVTVHRDTTSPSISSIVPAEGALLTSNMISMSVTVIDTSSLWVCVNNFQATQNGNVFSVAVPLSDGQQLITILAQDRAGNKTTVNRSITIDTQPPLPFTVTVTPSGWSNNPRPSVTFSTSDQTSGIDHYELKIDDGAYTRVTSPYTVPTLTDGTHSIIVKAIDKAGWEQSAAAQAFIDTAIPAAPSSFNLIPGTGKMIINYQAPSDDTVVYKIERSPAWDEGPKHTTELSLTESGLTGGDYYSYRVKAIDKAGNESAFTTWKSAMCGRELEPYIPTQKTIAEYDGANVFVPAQGLLDGSVGVTIREAQAPALEERAAFTHVSPIFDFAAVDNSGKAVKPGETLPQGYVGVIRYDASLIPAGLDEDDLDVYYFDPLWNCWRRCDSVVDKDTKQVYFTSRHFSLYEVQATAAKDLDPDEVKKNGYSPFRTYMQHGSMDVAPDNGGLSNRVTELVLPGPAGFDLTISRLYSTAYAKADALQVTETALLPYLRNKAEFAFTVAKGIRLDLPYIKNAGQNEFLMLPGGGGYSFFEMKMIESTSTQETDDNGNTYNVRSTIKLSPEESEDFVLTVEQYYNRKITIRYSSDDYEGQVVKVSGSTSYKLVMKDGSEYEFDGEGKPTKMTDANGLNSITLAYKSGGTQLDYIQDAIGRKVIFTYEPINNLSYIKTITVANDAPYNRVITYNHDENGYLTSETDVGGRTWSYSYVPYDMPAKQTTIPFDFYAAAASLNYKPLDDMITKSIGTQTKLYSIPLLTELRGPGKGILKAEYGQFSESMTGFTVTKRINIYTNEKNVTDDRPQRITAYDYIAKAYELPATGGVTIPAEKRGYINNCTAREISDKNETRETQYTWEAFAKKNTSWLISGGIEEGSFQVISTTGDNTYSVCNRRTLIEKKDYNSGITLEKNEYSYPQDSTTQRPNKTIATHGNDSATSNYTFDKYGNVVHEETVMLSKDRINKNVVKRVFIDDPDPTELDPNFKPYNFTVPQLIRAKHNLLLRQMVINYVPQFDNGQLQKDPQGKAIEQLQYQYINYQYNTVGQMTGTAVWDSSRSAWLISKAGYDYEADPAPTKAYGNIVYSENAKEEGTKFTYDANGFPASKKTLNVKNSFDTTSTDIIETYGYDAVSGWPIWQKNPRKYVTEYLYDKLGRVTDIVYPNDTDSLAYQGGGLTKNINPRPQNPKRHIDYGDNIGNLFATEIDPVGSKRTLQFDDFGQLVQVVTFDSAEQQTTLAQFSYNRWGQIAATTDQNGKTTHHEYDAMGRQTKIVYPDNTAGDADNPFKEFVYNYLTNDLTSYDELRDRIVTQYDMAGHVIATTSFINTNDANGITKTNYYDGLGNPIAAFGPRANEENYSTYNSINQLVSQVSSKETFFENEASIGPIPNESDFSYDEAGRLIDTSTVGPGNVRTIAHNVLDSLGRKIEVRVLDDKGVVLSTAKVGYDENGNVIKEMDPNNAMLTAGTPKVTVATYSARDKLLSTTDLANQKTTYRYNPDDTVDSIIGPRGNSGNYNNPGDFTIQFTYDDLKRLISASLPPKGPDGIRPTVTLTYDPRGNLTSRINPDQDNGKTTYTYTARNQAATQTVSSKDNALSLTTAYEYDKAGNLIKTTDPRNQTTRNTYDGLHRLIGVTLPDQKSTIGYEYDEANNRTTVIDGLGRQTVNTYSLYNKLTSTTTPEGAISNNASYRYYYDRLGNPTQTVDTLGNVRTYTYDRLNRLVGEKDEEGGLFAYQYDYMKSITQSSDPNGTVADYMYTPDYKLENLSLTNTRTSQSKNISYKYDEEGFVTQVTDGVVVSTYNNYDPTNANKYQPDAYNRIKKEVMNVDGKSFAVGYEYDVMDRLTRITYPNNNNVTYQYDALGEVTNMPGYVKTDSLTYVNGLLSTLTAANGIAANYEYDVNSRISKMKYMGKDNTVLKSYDLTYDLAGNIIQKNQDVFEYDNDNRLKTADLVGSFSVNPETLLQKVGAAGEDVNGDHQVDFDFSPEEVVDGVTIMSLDYNAGSIGVDLGDSYDISRIELTPLSSTNRVNPNSIRVFVSDDNNPKSYAEKKGFTATYVKKGDGTTILNINFTEKVQARFIKVKTDFNERDLITFNALNVAQFKNSPDKIIKVYYNVPTRTEKYTYDPMGNRRTESITLDKPRSYKDYYYKNTNRLLTNGRWAYQYDANGNIVGKSDTIMYTNTPTKVKDVPDAYWSDIQGSTDGITLTNQNNGVYWQYTFDLINRMIKVTKNGVDISAYTYNWKGYRVKKEKLNAAVDELRTTYYIFSPNGKLLYQEEEKYGEETANFYRQYDYLFGKTFAKDVGRIDTSGTRTGEARFYYHTDHLGSVTMITDESGNVAWSDEYTPFGSAADTTKKPDGGFKFASYTYDEDVQLNYALARWQDPETGRFTSLDPARSGMNWYVYCSNNPIAYMDPTGLTPYNIPRQYLFSSSPWTAECYSFQIALNYLKGNMYENYQLRSNAYSFMSVNKNAYMDAWQDLQNSIHYIWMDSAADDGTTVRNFYSVNIARDGGGYKQAGLTSIDESTYNQQVTQVQSITGNNNNLDWAPYGYGQTYCNVATSKIGELYGAPAIGMLKGYDQGPSAIYDNLMSGKYNKNTSNGFFQQVDYESAREYGFYNGFAIASSRHHVTSFMGKDKKNPEIATVFHVGGWHEIGEKTIWESFGYKSWEEFKNSDDVKYYIWIKYNAFETAWKSFKAENGFAGAALMERANWGGRTIEEQVTYEQKYGTPGGS